MKAVARGNRRAPGVSTGPVRVDAPGRRATIASLVAAAACAVLAGRSGAGHASESGALRRSWPSNRATPPLALPGYGGPAWSLEAAKGKVAVLNFWAGWCEPCRAEMPSLELLAARHESDGLVVIAVNYRETDAAIRRFLDQMPVMLPIVRDSDGAAARDWGVRVFPTTVVVGRDGRARFSVVGEADWTGSEVRQWLAPLLRERP
ncbi:MAG: TlpA family protein disulfide reductase [Nitrospira sp.]|nr:TlpA family protein disulfide reductase [Nitrospira sp.]